jgi:hypothetical protein
MEPMLAMAKVVVQKILLVKKNVLADFHPGAAIAQPRNIDCRLHAYNQS